jgi:uncharacterized protein YoxC
MENTMNDKELYMQKLQAQMDEWNADIAKLKAKAAGAKADVQIEMNTQVEALDRRMQEVGGKLSELAEASEEAWDSVKKGVESAWGSLKSAFGDAASRFNR